MNLELYVGKYVYIECNDDSYYPYWYVYAFSDKYDNPDREEDSIDILKNEDAESGVTLYASDIKSIRLAS